MRAASCMLLQTPVVPMVPIAVNDWRQPTMPE
jgi:hypothetical protein